MWEDVGATCGVQDVSELRRTNALGKNMELEKGLKTYMKKKEAVLASLIEYRAELINTKRG